jgi:ribosome biogenesis GTP-binding protein YsxC/EngB
MRITSSEFILGAVSLRQLPRNGMKEVAFLGRSNVGKSSLINKLCSRKSLARQSSDPGKTRELNYYLINKKFYFVDLPGYGYAKVPEQVRSSWGKLIEQYLKSRTQLSLVVQLVDARHEPTELHGQRAIRRIRAVPERRSFLRADRHGEGRSCSHHSAARGRREVVSHLSSANSQ